MALFRRYVKLRERDAAHDLTSAAKQVAKAIGDRHQFLRDDERERVAEILIKEVAKGISVGKEIALLDVDKNGKVDLDVYFVNDNVEQAIQAVSRRKLTG